MGILSCPIASCGFLADDVDLIGAAAILNEHSHAHTNSNPAPIPGILKLVCPKIKHNSTSEDWNAFLRRWETFRIGSGINAAVASSQLFTCTEEKLGNIILHAHPNFTSMSLNDSLSILKSTSVIPLALGAVRSDLAAMRQDPDEPFRTFAARVQGKAETWEFKTTYNVTSTECTTVMHGDVYYTDEAIRDVLLNDIAEMDIRREFLSTEKIKTEPITDIIAFVETRETARNANSTPSVSAISEYRRSTRDGPPNAPGIGRYLHQNSCLQAACTIAHPLTYMSRKHEAGTVTQPSHPHTRCDGCWKKNQSSSKRNNSSGSVNRHDSISQISSIHSSPAGVASSKKNMHSMDHQIFSKREWRKVKIPENPRVSLDIIMDACPSKHTHITADADTGAQSDLWSLDKFKKAGLKMS